MLNCNEIEILELDPPEIREDNAQELPEMLNNQTGKAIIITDNSNEELKDDRSEENNKKKMVPLFLGCISILIITQIVVFSIIAINNI